MAGVLAGFTIIGLVIALGYLAGRLRIGGPTAPQTLTQIAFFITTPALLLTVLAEADIGEIFSAYVPVAIISALGTATLYVVASTLFFRRPVGETAIGALSSSYVNANNIGIPMAVYALGNVTPVIPVLLLQLLILAPACLTLLDLTSGHAPSIPRILTQPFRNPVIIASFMGVALSWSGLELPTLIWEPLLLLGGAAVPLVLLAFGMSLHGNSPLKDRTHRVDVITATILKSLLMPMIAYCVAALIFRLDDELVFGAVLMAALPTAQNVFMYASRYDQGVTTSRDVVILSSAGAVPVLLIAAALLH